MAEFVMPKLGADMSAGTLVCWHKQVGDVVQRGDIIAEVETEKGNIDVEVFTPGTIKKFLVSPGQKVPVGTALAIIQGDAETEEALQAQVQSPAPIADVQAEQTTRAPVPSAARSAAPGRLAVSPSARRLARELGVDLQTVTGTGRGGVINREDIERAARNKQALPAGAGAPLQPADRALRMRQTIAAAMSRSKREIPHYYVSTTIDMHSALEWMSESNAKLPVAQRLLYGVLIVKAVALAVREVPELNAYWKDDRVVLEPNVHVGLAIALRQNGLVAPALHHTDRLSLDELMTRMRDLVNRTRAGSLKSSELSDPTITVTSLGEQGVESVYGVIYPPQVAMVGVGKIVERPWCVDGAIVPRRVVTVTLAADHRVSDGHRGGRFLAAVERLLQEPSKL